MCICIHQLEFLAREAPDGAFFLWGTDFELLPDLVDIQQHIRGLARNLNIDIQFSTMPRWLSEYGQPKKIVDLEPIGHGIGKSSDMESFSRWVLKPLDIRIRHYSVPAMAAIRRAELITGALGEREKEVDIPIAQTISPSVDNPWDTMFEHALEFPEDEQRYLYHQGKSTALSRAYHHLLIGVNSDAIGWSAWEPRWQHRVGELTRAQILADEVTTRALDMIANEVIVPKVLQGVDRLFLVFNPTRAHATIISVYSLQPGYLLEPSGEVLSGMIHSDGTKCIVTAQVSLPDYGYLLLGFKTGAVPQEPSWTEGRSIAAGSLLVSLNEQWVTLRAGERSARLSIPPFRLEDPSHVCPIETVVPDLSQAHTRVRETPFGPQLELFHETAWAVQTRLVFTLQGEDILCEADFWFYLPRWVGERGWNPEGLRLELVGEPGDLWYSTPFGVIQHKEKDLVYAAMHRFATLQAKDGGMAILPSSGVQGIRAIPGEGKLALRLGASALGELDARPYITFDKKGNAYHHQHQTAAVFMGHHTHRFVIRLYGGDWRKADLPERGRQFQESPAIREIKPPLSQGTRPPVASLLTVEPRSVDIAGFRVLNEQPEAIMYETWGRPASAILRIDQHLYQTKLTPWGIAVIKIK